MIFKKISIIFLCISTAYTVKNDDILRRPNIVAIIADDMGSHDMSFTGMNQFFTPNLDALAYSGTILPHHYTPNLCTPSRAAFLTGKDPLHTGMQSSLILSEQPWGLPLKEILMPQIFKDNGYKTHLVGKWHLGHFKKEYTPLYRGFDTHFGYYTGHISYFNHSVGCTMLKGCSLGVDFRSQLKTNFSLNGKYATDLFTKEAVQRIKSHNTTNSLFLVVSHLAPHTGSSSNPLEAPKETINKFNYIKDEKRRIYAAMVHKLDKSIGEIVEALEQKGILEDTIILFFNDNGAPTEGKYGRGNAGSNYPLRGQKATTWEGALRSSAVVWSNKIKDPGNIYDQVISVTDWFPTLLSAANIPYNTSKLDGIHLWNRILGNDRDEKIDRRIYHVFDQFYNYTSIRDGKWKYINGSHSFFYSNEWLGEIGKETANVSNYATLVENSKVGRILLRSGKQSLEQTTSYQVIRDKLKINCSNGTIVDCDPSKQSCLYNIDIDPCERKNVADKFPDIMEYFESLIKDQQFEAEPSAYVDFLDPSANPALHNNTWTFWRDNFKD